MGIKGWVTVIFGALFLSIVGVSLIQSSKIDRLQTELSYSKANEKALFAERDSLKDNSRTLQLTVDQLNYINDSIIVKMNAVRKELGIKDKNIKELQYQLSEASKTDTVIFRDTLFRDPSVNIDTTMSDKWYSVNLKLKYPSTVTVTPSFVSEKYIYQSYRKETVNPPKKCFIGRWFQKRHIILETEIIEKSPYIINKKQKFIKIID